MWYFRSNAVFLNYHMFKMTSNLDNLTSSIISMFRMVDILFIIDLVVIAFRNIRFRKTYTKYKRNVVGGVAILAVSLIYLGYARIKIDVKETLSSLKENNPDNEYRGIMKGKNLLLIQWESLETFIVNQEIDGQEITPNLSQ